MLDVPIVALCKFSSKCRSSHRKRRAMTCWLWPMKTRSSQTICLTAPGIRVPLPALPGWCRRVGCVQNSPWHNQMQDRFIAQFKRLMTALDMQAWTAVRMIGEATSRQNSADPNKILDFLKGPNSRWAPSKAKSSRWCNWISSCVSRYFFTDGRTIVSVSPQQGFLHQFSELDTLGYDRPETQCKLQ